MSIEITGKDTRMAAMDNPMYVDLLIGESETAVTTESEFANSIQFILVNLMVVVWLV